jgi:hypothetical protein
MATTSRHSYQWYLQFRKTHFVIEGEMMVELQIRELVQERLQVEPDQIVDYDKK